jgi:hypothetical protein
MKKLTFEYVKQYFKDNGCELLETEYINNSTKMKYKCSCGNISYIAFSHFKNGSRCKKCGNKKIREKKQLSYEYVYTFFKDRGSELLEDTYINAHHKMTYRCTCGNISGISFNDFKYGKRCMKCSENEKLTFEHVKQYFEDHGCYLLEKEYINCRTKMKYRCLCGNISEIDFNHFQQGNRCLKCSGSEKLTIEYVKQYFKDNECEMLTNTYINNETKMSYRCSCGNVSQISFTSFQRGSRCNKCRVERIKQTKLKRYGVPYFNDCGYSKESQKLFDEIYVRLNEEQKNKTYYATLNKEFSIDYKGKCFQYDYVNSRSKKTIEYNGSAWHPTSNLKNSDRGWHIINKTKTAGEARLYEQIKYEGLEKRGYKILTVWDYEFYSNFRLYRESEKTPRLALGSVTS